MDNQQIELFDDEEVVKGQGIPINPMIRSYGTGPAGTQCKTCIHLYGKKWDKTYYKCRLRGDTNGPGTDHRLRWQSCGKYEDQKDR